MRERVDRSWTCVPLHVANSVLRASVNIRLYTGYSILAYNLLTYATESSHFRGFGGIRVRDLSFADAPNHQPVCRFETHEFLAFSWPMQSLHGAARCVVAMAHFDAAEIEDQPIGSVGFRYSAVRATSHFTKRATPPKITCIIPTSTRRISTNMNSIDAVIEAIELREAGASFSYRKIAN